MLNEEINAALADPKFKNRLIELLKHLGDIGEANNRSKESRMRQ
jgi:hypothetical protein